MYEDHDDKFKLKKTDASCTFNKRGHICARVKREGPSMGFRCGFVSCSTDAEGPGHLPAVLTIHYFITMQQFVYCQQPVWNNNLQ